MLGRDEILSRKDLKREKVSIPEWGGDVLVSEMTAEARDAWEQESIIIGNQKKTSKNIYRARFIIRVVVDEEGNLLFNDSDIEKLGKLSANALDRICSAGQRLNGMTKENLEEATGNSDAGPSGDSISS